MGTSTLPVSFCESTDVRVSQSKPLATSARCPENAVLALAQAGNPDAFSELYSRQRKRVFAICLHIVRDFWLAEDLTQETFLQLHRKLTIFRGDSDFTKWLDRMTVNVVLMHLRKHVLPVVSLDPMMTDIPMGHVGWGFGTCDRRQIGVVNRVAIERATGTLAPGYRKFCLLHDVQGFEHREIASMEGCSLGDSKSQLHKARRALRHTLSAQPAQRLPD